LFQEYMPHWKKHQWLVVIQSLKSILSIEFGNKKILWANIIFPCKLSTSPAII
jgi:hypothetical protein